MEETSTIKIKCPQCDKEFGISINVFDYAEIVKVECWDGVILTVSFDKKTKTLAILQEAN